MTPLALVQRCYVACLLQAPGRSSEAEIHVGYTLSLELAPSTCGYYVALNNAYVLLNNCPVGFICWSLGFPELLSTFLLVGWASKVGLGGRGV